MKRRRLQPEDYTVGWICALPLKLRAATKMLDEEHDNLPQEANHPNLYTLGRISEHHMFVRWLRRHQFRRCDYRPNEVQVPINTV